MASFPALKTGAVAQYPIAITGSYRADIVQFMDGSEQRFRNAPSILFSWELNLAGLDEQEMAAVEEFYLANQGATEMFTFTDPWTNVAYPNCSISLDTFQYTATAPFSNATKVTIRQNRV